MSGILAQLGITESAPDPSAYMNQKEVSSQLEEVKKDVQSTLDTVTIAVDTAELLGVNADSLSTLKAIQSRALNLLSNTSLTPSEIEKRRKELDDSYMNAKKDFTQTVTKDHMESLKAAAETVRLRVEEVKADKTIPLKIREKYDELAAATKKALDTITTTVRTKGEIPADALRADVVLDTLSRLNDEKEAEENKTFNIERAVSRGKKYVRLGIGILTVAIAAILGGIVLSNTFALEAFFLIKLFYFVYGAAFFPASLLYGIARPPVWQASLFPWSKREQISQNTWWENWFTYYPYTDAEIAAIQEVKDSKGQLRKMSIGCFVLLGGAAYMFDWAGYFFKRGG